LRKVLWIVVAFGVVSLLWLALARRDEPTPPETDRPKVPEAPAKAPPAGEQSAPSVSVAKDSRLKVPSPSLAALPAAKPPHVELPLIELPPGVSAGIRLIVGLTSQKDYTVRAAAVHSLGMRLSRVDMEGLYAFLKSRVANHPDLDVLSLGALKNDALQVLIAQDTLPPDLLQTILDMYRDPALDVTWRDYCLQHVAVYYERRWRPQDVSRLDDPDRQAVMKLYEEALASRVDGMEGTAMIGLVRLSERYPEIDRAGISVRALEAAQDEHRDPATRVTAMGICGLMGKAEALPAARILAQTGENTALRLASIGTIGLIGTADDLDLMQSLAAGSDVVVRKAAQAAVTRIQSRTQKAER